MNVSAGFNGTFLVRPSVHGGQESPYSLTLYYKGRTYNLNIRLLPDGTWVLGKKKANEVVNIFQWLVK